MTVWVKRFTIRFLKCSKKGETSMPHFAACGLRLDGKIERRILSSFDAARAYAIDFKKSGYLLAYVESEGAEDPKILYTAKGE